MGVLSTSRSSRANRRAVTLIEVLVVVTVIGVVLGLALPALFGARTTARTARALATMRSLGGVVTIYTDDARGFLPYCGVEHKPWRGLMIRGHALDEPYFFQSMFYVNLLVPDYLPAFPRRETPVPDGPWLKYAAFGIDRTSYMMTATAFASPVYWTDPFDPDDLSIFRGQQAADCVHPSRKVLILNNEFGIHSARGFGPRNAFMALTFDGAAGVRAYSTDLDAFSVSRPLGAMPMVGMSTVGGLRGWDF